MNVRVKLFAVAKELVGGNELALDVRNGATVADVRQAVTVRYPQLAHILPHALWAVDAEYVTDNTVLNEHSNVALIPPVSGG
jgi:molybdopterin synthase sulfur carrier subunit